MDLSILDDSLHHELIPHREQSATYGISSSSFFDDKFLPPIDPTLAFWNPHPTFHPLPPPQDSQMAIAFPYPPLPTYTYDTHDESVSPGAREKRHCCQLCNKRFDRPSTLKKHMLVHTGEKAWACEICERRFSVSSNLNRHTRRCREKWAKADNSATDTPSASSSPPEHSLASPPPPPPTPTESVPDSHRQSSPQMTDRPKRRHSAPCTVQQHETDDGSRSHDQRHLAGKPYRPRRKGSPTEPWIPASLVNFNFRPTRSVVSTPLPAVTRTPDGSEERDSYDNTPLQAYHPSCWTGQLVGPSHTPKDEEFSRGRYYGKLLVF